MIKGTLMVTNLRVLFVELKRGGNMSIGWGNVTKVEVRAKNLTATANQDTVKHPPKLTVITKSKNENYIFEFLAPNPQLPKVFVHIKRLHSIFQQTTLYREIKLRLPKMVNNGEVVLLGSESGQSQREILHESVNGVFNLSGTGSSSTSAGMIGCLTLTNVRIIWHANHSHDFNLSVPFNQVKEKGIKLRETKFGRVVSITVRSGDSFGFRIDPTDRLNSVSAHMIALFKTFSKSPLYGVYLPKINITIQSTQQSSDEGNDHHKGKSNNNHNNNGGSNKSSPKKATLDKSFDGDNSKDIMDGLLILEQVCILCDYTSLPLLFHNDFLLCRFLVLFVIFFFYCIHISIYTYIL
mmetsp:Transcript_34321/g.44282  ORF Transcript_34321/g.44282 Transcript_34321/m.44282 type:complete len:352 (+) Transcript_34321:1357-2412(+)